MRRLVLAAAAAVVLALPASAQEATPDDGGLPPSQCLAIAQNIGLPRVWHASMTANPLDTVDEDGTVIITFAGHATYTIQTPDGVTIATDFSGLYGADPLPRIVTMNRAHSSHYTLNPDPGIEYVFTGWNPEGGVEGIEHAAVIDDVYVRNVTTDIRGFGDRDSMIPNANSIFIFEVAGLCIGHLGHLHHPLTEDHYVQIGRLDIVMAPVDGGLTMSHARMAELTERLRSSVLLPMHLRGNSINNFISMMGEDWATDFLDGDTVTFSVRTLPKRPTIFVPESLSWRG